MYKYPKWKSYLCFVWYFFFIPSLCWYAGRQLFPNLPYLGGLLGIVCTWSLWWAGGEALENAERKYIKKKEEEYQQYLYDHKPSTVSSDQATRAIAAAEEAARIEHARVSAAEHQQRKEDLRNIIIGMVAFAVVIAIIAFFIVRHNETNAASKSTYPATYASTYNTNRPVNTATPTPTVTPTPIPVTIYNGKRIINSDYNATCPFSIVADSSSNYYIYLDYQYGPTNSTKHRTIKSGALSPYESDIAFIVEAGKSVSIDVPIGVYRLYYATGKTFYGPTLLFGDDTEFYTSDESLSFYYSGGYYNGHTITLYATYDGNFDTKEISEKNFPVR